MPKGVTIMIDEELDKNQRISGKKRCKKIQHIVTQEPLMIC